MPDAGAGRELWEQMIPQGGGAELGVLCFCLPGFYSETSRLEMFALFCAWGSRGLMAWPGASHVLCKALHCSCPCWVTGTSALVAVVVGTPSPPLGTPGRDALSQLWLCVHGSVC